MPLVMKLRVDKQVQEADRMEMLAKHKKGCRGPILKRNGNTGLESTSGGMSASVDEDGELVWD